MNDNDHGQLTVFHVGPSSDVQGGIGSVINELALYESSELKIVPVATWWRGKPVRSLASAVRVASRVVRERSQIDVVHVHLSEGGSFVREGGVAIAARVAGIPTCATLHGAGFSAFAVRHPRLVRGVLKSLSVVFCLGGRTESQISLIDPAIRTARVMNPITVSDQADRRQSPPVVVMAGELGYRKGIDRLLAAWDGLREGPDLPRQLCLIGPKNETDGLTFPTDAQVLGVLPRDETLRIIGRSTVAVLPSRQEVLPMFVLESLAAGVPVVYSRVGDWDSFADCEAVATIDFERPDAIQSLTDELTRLLSLSAADLTDLGQQAREWVESRASTAVVTADLVAVYLTLVGFRDD